MQKIIDKIKYVVEDDIFFNGEYHKKCVSLFLINQFLGTICFVKQIGDAPFQIQRFKLGLYPYFSLDYEEFVILAGKHLEDMGYKVKYYS